MGGKVRLDTRRLVQLQKNLEPRAQALINKAAFDIERGAKERAPVRTGHLKDSIATALSKLKAVVSVGAEYGIYVELGTRRMRARPFLIPAFEAVNPKFLAVWKQLVELK